MMHCVDVRFFHFIYSVICFDVLILARIVLLQNCSLSSSKQAGFTVRTFVVNFRSWCLIKWHVDDVDDVLNSDCLSYAWCHAQCYILISLFFLFAMINFRRGSRNNEQWAEQISGKRRQQDTSACPASTPFVHRRISWYETERLTYEWVNYSAPKYWDTLYSILQNYAASPSHCSTSWNVIWLINVKRSSLRNMGAFCLVSARIYSVCSDFYQFHKTSFDHPCLGQDLKIISRTSVAHLCRHSCAEYMLQRWLIVFDGSSSTMKDGNSGEKSIGPCWSYLLYSSCSRQQILFSHS